MDDERKRALIHALNRRLRGSVAIDLAPGPTSEEMETFTPQENLSLLLRDAVLRCDFQHELLAEIDAHIAHLTLAREQARQLR